MGISCQFSSSANLQLNGFPELKFDGALQINIPGCLTKMWSIIAPINYPDVFVDWTMMVFIGLLTDTIDFWPVPKIASSFMLLSHPVRLLPQNNLLIPDISGIRGIIEIRNKIPSLILFQRNKIPSGIFLQE
jgi:hypothetical protein